MESWRWEEWISTFCVNFSVESNFNVEVIWTACFWSSHLLLFFMSRWRTEMTNWWPNPLKLEEVLEIEFDSGCWLLVDGQIAWSCDADFGLWVFWGQRFSLSMLILINGCKLHFGSPLQNIDIMGSLLLIQEIEVILISRIWSRLLIVGNELRITNRWWVRLMFY